MSALHTTFQACLRLPKFPLSRTRGSVVFGALPKGASPTLAHGLTYGVDLLPRHPIEAAQTGSY